LGLLSTTHIGYSSLAALPGNAQKKKETLIRLLGNTPFLMQIPKKVREREKKKEKEEKPIHPTLQRPYPFSVYRLIKILRLLKNQCNA